MKTKITGTQLALLLLVSRMCSLFVFTPIFNSAKSGSGAMIGHQLSVILQIVILIPMMIFWHKKPNISILDYLISKNKIIGKIVIFAFLIYFVFQIISSLFYFQFFLANTFYPEVSALAIISIMIICCMYSARLGIEGISRSGFILFFFFLAALITIISCTVKSFDILNIKPVSLLPIEYVFNSLIKNFSGSGELLLLLIFSPNVKTSMTKCSIKYVILSGVIIEITSFIMQGVLGEYLSKHTFPFYAFSRISGTKLLGRLDAIQMTLWVTLAFVRITIFLLASNICFKKIIKPKEKSNKSKKLNFSIVIIGTVTSLSAFYLAQHKIIINEEYISIVSSLVLLVLVFIVPLITNIFFKKKGETAL